MWTETGAVNKPAGCFSSTWFSLFMVMRLFRLYAPLKLSLVNRGKLLCICRLADIWLIWTGGKICQSKCLHAEYTVYTPQQSLPDSHSKRLGSSQLVPAAVRIHFFTFSTFDFFLSSVTLSMGCKTHKDVLHYTPSLTLWLLCDLSYVMHAWCSAEEALTWVVFKISRWQLNTTVFLGCLEGVQIITGIYKQLVGTAESKIYPPLVI